MGELRAREPLGDGLIEPSTVPGQDLDFAVVVDDLEVISQELDQLSCGTGDQRLSDDVRVAAEAPPPQLVGENRHGRRADLELVFAKEAAWASLRCGVSL